MPASEPEKALRSACSGVAARARTATVTRRAPPGVSDGVKRKPEAPSPARPKLDPKCASAAAGVNEPIALDASVAVCAGRFLWMLLLGLRGMGQRRARASARASPSAIPPACLPIVRLVVIVVF